MPGTFFYKKRKKVAAAPPASLGVANHNCDATSTNVTTYTHTFGFTPTSGNKLVMLTVQRSTNGSWTSEPSGWTKEASGVNGNEWAVYSKTSDGTETSASWTKSSATRAWASAVVEVEGWTTCTYQSTTLAEQTTGPLTMDDLEVWLGWARVGFDPSEPNWLSWVVGSPQVTGTELCTVDNTDAISSCKVEGFSGETATNFGFGDSFATSNNDRLTRFTFT